MKHFAREGMVIIMSEDNKKAVELIDEEAAQAAGGVGTPIIYVCPICKAETKYTQSDYQPHCKTCGHTDEL